MVAGAFLVISMLWIVVSDRMAYAAFPDLRAFNEFQTLKGLGYVFAASLVLFGLVRYFRMAARKYYLELFEYQRKLQLALEATQQGFWIHYPETNKTEVSPEFWQLLGFPGKPEVLTTEQWDQIIHPEDAHLWKEEMKKLTAGKKSGYLVLYRIHHQVSGETRWMRSKARVFEWDADGRPKAVLGLVTDVTDLMEQSTLIKNQEMRIEGFNFMNSHMLRGPLANVKGLLHLLEEEQTPPPEVVNFLKKEVDRLDEKLYEINELLERQEFFTSPLRQDQE